MKTSIKTGIFAITLLISTEVLAASINVGQRAYSPKSINVWVTDHLEKRELGTGVVAKIFSGKNVIFHSDEFGPVELTIEDPTAIEPLVQCPFKFDEMFYSTMAYDAPITLQTGKPAWEKREVGFATVKEVFGNCQNGRAFITPAADDAPRMVPVASLLREVQCEFTGKRVSAIDYGTGIAREVYGNCKTGPVLFKADRNVAYSIVLPATSITISLEPGAP